MATDSAPPHEEASGGADGRAMRPGGAANGARSAEDGDRRGAPEGSAKDSARGDDAAARGGRDGSGSQDRRTDMRRDDEDPDAEADEGDAKGDSAHKKGLLHRPVLLAALAAFFGLALIGGLVFWLNARNFETTDDAFIDTHIVRVAPQIAGQVKQVFVNDNEAVRPGQPLVEIDSADVGTRVAQAKAQKAQAEAQVETARAQVATNTAAYKGALADHAAARAQAANAAMTLARYERLAALNPDAVAPQQLDQARTEARQTAAQALSAQRAAEQRADQIRASRAQLSAGADQVAAAQSQVNEAGINLAYARIAAPVAGHVAQKTVAVGAYVQPGTELMAVVPTALWVTANFKETQLALMRIGQKAEVRADACPKARIEGHVDSVERGAGQAFGVLPPENATGNFVKVVQRVPVKIVIDHLQGPCLLGPGMSVEPKVRVR